MCWFRDCDVVVYVAGCVMEKTSLKDLGSSFKERDVSDNENNTKARRTHKV